MDQGLEPINDNEKVLEFKPNNEYKHTGGESTEEGKGLTVSDLTVYNKPEDISPEFPQEEDEQLEESKYLTQEHTEEETTLPELIIDEELRDLIPRLVGEERKQLEDNIIKDGCRDAIVVWDEDGKKIIVDGMNRYEICRNRKIPFKINEKSFVSREEVHIWILDNQLGRRNLTAVQKTILIGKIYNKKKKSSLANLIQNKTEDAPRDQNDLSEEIYKKTAILIGEQYGVSQPTVKRSGKFAEGIDIIIAKKPEKKSELLSGKGPFTKKEVENLPNIPPEEQAEKVEQLYAPKTAESTRSKLEIIVDEFKKMTTHVSHVLEQLEKEQLENALDTINKVKAEMEAQLAKMNEQQA
jgi:hypothetical protein